MAFSIGGALLAAGNIGASIFGASKAASGQREANNIARQQLALQQRIADFNMEQAAQTRPYAIDAMNVVRGLGTIPFDTARDNINQTNARGIDAINRNLNQLDAINSYINMLLGRRNDGRFMDRVDASQRDQDFINTEIRARNATNDRLSLEARDNAQGAIDRNRAAQEFIQQYLFGRQNQLDTTAAAERAAEVADVMALRDVTAADRNRILDTTGRLRTDLASATSALGNLAPVRTYTNEDVQREAEIRAQEARRSVDRAAQVAASANEAGLISSGVDASSTGTQRRSELAARLAPLYEEAYTRSRTGALDYIRGLQGAESATLQNNVAHRNAVLTEIINSALAPLQAESRLPALQSIAGIRSANGPQLNIGPTQEQINPLTGINANWQSANFTRPTEWAQIYNQNLGVNDGAVTSAFGQASGANNLINQIIATLGGNANSSIQNMSGALNTLNALASTATQGGRAPGVDAGPAINFANQGNTMAGNANTALGTALGNFATKFGPGIERGIGNLFSGWGRDNVAANFAGPF